MFAFLIVLVRYLIGPTYILFFKSTVWAQRTDARRKTDPRLVYLDEGRDPLDVTLGRGPSRGRGIEFREDP